MERLAPYLTTEDGWSLTATRYDAITAITEGSNFMIGNGYLGYRGTFAEARKADYAACIVTDTWDKADGKWEELTTVPNALFTRLYEGDVALSPNDAAQQFERVLDLRTALSKRRVLFQTPKGHTVKLEEEKFASAANKHLVLMRYALTAENNLSLNMWTGIDKDVWSLNGQHLLEHERFEYGKSGGIQSETGQSNIPIVVLEKVISAPAEPFSQHNDDNIIGRILNLHLKAGQTVVLEKAMIIVTGNDCEDPQAEAKKLADAVQSYADAYSAHCAVWNRYWQTFDIEITGSLTDQVAVRFNLYHALIATPRHKPLPMGARGLSCQAYQGAAFWDQEIYNLPMYLYRDHTIARQLLEYRYQTLDGARRKAHNHGYEGAFYAWISGKTGDELCPDFFFKDVLSGRDIRNHFNLWQIHISADIAYTIDVYEKVTDDWSFIELYGAEMVFEIARFIASRVDYKPRRGRYELIRVQGPDEYHENVDNNTFTNVMAQETLAIARRYWDTLSSEVRMRIAQKIKLEQEELALWKDIEQKLYLPKQNEKGLIEQFDGYFKLESIVPARKVTARLINDEEYYGWPNGIAVFTQCLKQADLIQLFSLYPTRYPLDVMRKNYDYYEPRTLHFSSLSPSTYAIVAARLDKREEAYTLFKRAVMIDLLNTNEAVSGGTFIGGMHTAANGAAWMMVVMGFLGWQLTEDGFSMTPRLPASWQRIKTRLTLKNQTIQIDLTPDVLTIQNVSVSPKPLTIKVYDDPVQVSSVAQAIKLT